MSFSEDAKSFSLEINPLKSEEQLSSGLWLVLAGINETPPHIAIVNEGKYYSLSTRKIDNGSPLERFMNTINRKSIPTVFVHIESTSNYEPLLQSIYTDIQLLGNNEDTCLSPIKDFFTIYFSPEFSKVNYIFELLALAERKSLIKECITLFPENTSSNNITLPKYTMAQIRNRINVHLT